MASHALFPRLSPPMPESRLKEAADKAFQECGLTRRGQRRSVASTPRDLVRATLVNAEEVFLDAIFHEMHRHKMQMGDYYHKLILELMKSSRVLENSNIQDAKDGSREGDIIADLKTVRFGPGIRVYGSVKKSGDTVGGQDFEAAVHRLERVAREDQGRRKPYLCAFMIGNPVKGIVRAYKNSRYIRGDRLGRAYSENGEVWEPLEKKRHVYWQKNYAGSE